MELEEKLYMERLDGGIARIVWNNPPLNLTTMALMQRFEKLVMEAADDDSVRVLIIAAAGERAFCVGSDIKEFPEISRGCTKLYGEEIKREPMVIS